MSDHLYKQIEQRRLLREKLEEIKRLTAKLPTKKAHTTVSIEYATALENENKTLTAENKVLREDNLTLMATNAEQFKDSERLTKDLSHWKYVAADYEISSSQQENERLQARVEKLETALEIYADSQYWNKDGTHVKGLGPGIAKRALAATEGESNE